jgi:hypothetical protein
VKRLFGARGARFGALLLTCLFAVALSLVSADAKPKRKKPAPEASATRLAPPIRLSQWINTKPLDPRALEGTPRLVEFWAIGSAKSQNSVLAMREIYGLYAKQGLRVLGIHTPESSNERDSSLVAAAVKKHGIGFPVGLDNDSTVFRGFKNKYWPAIYVVDREGVVRATHVGELHVGTRAWRNLCASIERVLAAKPVDRRS